MIYKQLKIKSVDETNGIIIGTASAYGNYDYDNDRFIVGCNTESLRRGTNKMLLFNHDHHKPVGTAKLTDTSTELMIEAQFNMGTTLGKDTFLMFKKWYEDSVEEVGFSVGGIVEDYTTNEQNGWDIKTYNLFEVSVVTLKANTEATMATVKNKVTKGGETMEKKLQEILDEVKSLKTEITTLSTELKELKGTVAESNEVEADEEADALDELDAMLDELNEQFEDEEENENSEDEGEEE